MTIPAIPAPQPASVTPAVPAEFLNPETGEVDVEALFAAYMALKQQVAAGPIGVPDSPDGYQIAAPHALLEADPEVNARLHAAGFTPEQVQLVYDLAAERVIPVIEAMAADMDGDRELSRLIEHFGGEERWGEISRQLQAWGKANLPADVLTALSGTADGVMALFRMMQSGEPGLGGMDKGAAGPSSEDEVKALMRDPKYWRDRDPATVRKVAEGFKRLYPGA
ncbi:hypothetical protein C882_1984 [Caenispirillum salinarum AK4]|uniref:Uncharacterized protein n=1 Tax=Caenispirillum salinarum AK4 TaxID=1238182 RepID=K9GM16_9PROT|nr:hypothetical protein [Caenispirillum salinarum]EKV27055.1 hypothetical protein C882_1984 [Caenispirillum salinarum AK4]